jgi:large subunit ribosomal protein L6
MKKEIFQEIEIPEGIEANFEEDTLIVKGPEGENKRKFNLRNIIFEIKDKKIRIGNEKATKKDKKRINTITAHIKNMIKGIKEKFVYKLKTVFSHFPITVEVSGNEVTIKNFLGEKVPRKCSIPKDAEVKVDKNIITVSSYDKEIAGQAAANLERVTKIKNKDKRVFQDGIYIVNKAGREI